MRIVTPGRRFEDHVVRGALRMAGTPQILKFN